MHFANTNAARLHTIVRTYLRIYQTDFRFINEIILGIMKGFHNRCYDTLVHYKFIESAKS